MEFSSAEMICVLKVNTQCAACKGKVMQVLKNISGVYNMTIDGEEETVKVTGRVNPNTLLNVLEKYKKHAKVKYVKFKGEVVERNPYYYGYNPYDGLQYSSYPPPLPCSHFQSYHHNYPHFSQPCPFLPPQVPYNFPPPPPSGPCRMPPPPPFVYGYGPPSSMSIFPPRNLIETSRECKQNKCAMM